MALRDRLRRLTRLVEEDGVLIRQRSGTVRAFDVLDVQKDMFLAQYELFKGEAYPAEILEAVRNATPESKAAFEERFGEIHMVARIIAPEKDGGWVEVFTLLEDGAVERVLHEGDSVEAERIRQEVRGGR